MTTTLPDPDAGPTQHTTPAKQSHPIVDAHVTSATDRKHRRLGRGLASLISISAPADALPPAPAAQADRQTPSDPAARQPHMVLANLLVDSIEPNPDQPRRVFDEAALAGLADSILANGLVQPVLVRRHRDGGGADSRFQLIAGERRWRAARLAGIESIPAIIKSLDDDMALELALIENIQRADLNPIERAAAYRAMLNSRGMSADQLAQRLGENRASVSNYLRLLDLPDDIQRLVIAGTLGFGHARALLGLRSPQHQRMLAESVVKLDWSVRRVEELVAQALADPSGEGALERLLVLSANPPAGGHLPVKPAPPPKPANIVSLEEKLTRRLGTRVSIRQGRRPDLGKLVIDFYCLDDFDRILEALGIMPD